MSTILLGGLLVVAAIVEIVIIARKTFELWK